MNSILKEKTCVKLREVDIKEAPGFDNYMILDNSPDYVTGKVGGKQVRLQNIRSFLFPKLCFEIKKENMFHLPRGYSLAIENNSL